MGVGALFGGAVWVMRGIYTWGWWEGKVVTVLNRRSSDVVRLCPLPGTFFPRSIQGVGHRGQLQVRGHSGV